MKLRSIVPILLGLLLLTGCTQVPEMGTILTEYAGNAFQAEDRSLTPAKLEKAWGTPLSRTDSAMVWEKDGKYVEAGLENGRVVSLTGSVTLTCTVVRSAGDGAVYCVSGTSGFDIGTLFSFPADALDEAAAAGAVLEVEYGGIMLETFPAQLPTPYAVRTVGETDDPDALTALMDSDMWHTIFPND